ncbi:MAG: hypothetical protein FJ121_08305 [Deltaproteobacteria bacterium]|nr:hypothetical protein [Deltaproteobacteria bacterium]
MRFFCGKRAVLALLTVAAVMMLPLSANAITFTLPVQPDGKQAQVTFTPDFTADTLTITLAELGVAAMANADVLTAVYWDMTPGVALTAVSATGFGATGPYFVTGDVGHNWRYVTGFVPPVVTASYALSTVGAAIPGGGGFGNIPSSGGSTNIDGVDYGIVNGIFGTDRGQFPRTDPYVSGYITFIFGIPTDVVSLDFSNVSFNYSSGVDNRMVPIPPSALLLGSGLLGLGLVGWRRRGKKA